MAGAQKEELTMSEDMLSKVLVRELPGLMRDFMKKVLGENGQEWVAAFKLFLKKQNPWSEVKAVTKKAASKLLKFITGVELPAVDRFSVRDVIKSGEINEVKFWFSENFKSIFGLVETNVPAVRMLVHELKKDSTDGPIIAELGDPEKKRAFVAHIFKMVVRQGHGEKGVLLTNGWANIAYIPDPEDAREALGGQLALGLWQPVLGRPRRSCCGSACGVRWPPGVLSRFWFLVSMAFGHGAMTLCPLTPEGRSI